MLNPLICTCGKWKTGRICRGLFCGEEAVWSLWWLLSKRNPSLSYAKRIIRWPIEIPVWSHGSGWKSFSLIIKRKSLNQQLSEKEMKQLGEQSLKTYYHVSCPSAWLPHFGHRVLSLKFVKTYSPLQNRSPSGTVTVQKGSSIFTEDLLQAVKARNQKNKKKESQRLPNTEIRHLAGSRRWWALLVTSGSIVVTLVSGLNSFLGSTDAA